MALRRLSKWKLRKLGLEGTITVPGASVVWAGGPGEAKVEVGLKIGDAKAVLE